MVDQMSNSSAETVADNDDLLTEGILLRLPPKSLVRFQSVCKHWRSIILSLSFCRVHTRRSTHSGGGTFIFTPSESDVIHFNPVTKAIHKFQVPHTSEVNILQSSNGLWLLELDGGQNYSVHNPSTKQSRLLALPPRADGGADDRRRRRETSLVFDPSASIHYKVFFVYFEWAEMKFRVETFDSETDEWTIILYSSTSGRSRYPQNFDWLHSNNKVYSMSLSKNEASSFLDLQTGKVVPLPELNLTDDKPGVGLRRSSWDFSSRYHFMGSNGRLRCVIVAEYYYINDRNDLDETRIIERCLLLLELTEDDSGWLEVCNVNIDRILGVDIRTRRVGVIRGVDRREGRVLLHVEGKFVSYRFWDGNFELVLNLKALPETSRDDLMPIMISPFFGLHKIFPFIQSLAPV